jgi:GNAT superfamily N-acetyltransferase
MSAMRPPNSNTQNGDEYAIVNYYCHSTPSAETSTTMMLMNPAGRCNVTSLSKCSRMSSKNMSFHISFSSFSLLTNLFLVLSARDLISFCRVVVDDSYSSVSLHVKALSYAEDSTSLSSFGRIRYRSARPNDELPIAAVMAKELMNPFGISHKNNLLVAEDRASGERVGWAQVRSMGYATIATNPSKFENDTVENNSLARRDTQSSLSIEQDVDEIMWREFEEDPVEFPNGFSSLPWSKEYRAASKAADDRLKRRHKIFQDELERRPRLWELSSVYVLPEFRNQGIGSDLITGVLTRTNRQKGKYVYALTLAKTVPWYEQFGFVQEAEIPKPMAFEVAAGKVVTKLIGEELVCIRTSI